MSNIADDVMETFLARLADVDAVSDAVIEGLCERLRAERLPSPDDIVKLYASGSGDAIA